MVVTPWMDHKEMPGPWWGIFKQNIWTPMTQLDHDGMAGLGSDNMAGSRWNTQAMVGHLDPKGDIQTPMARPDQARPISYRGRRELSRSRRRGMSSVVRGDGVSVAVERQPEDVVGEDAAVAQGVSSPGYHTSIPSLQGGDHRVGAGGSTPGPQAPKLTPQLPLPPHPPLPPPCPPPGCTG